MKRIIFILVLFTNFTYSQNSPCVLSYKNILKVFNLNSHEEIDNELRKYNYVFDFNSSYSHYWNKQQKSNFSIYRDETTNEINLVTVDVNEKCYQNLKKEIILAGFIKVNEKIGQYRLDFFYKKNDSYVILAKKNTYDLDGRIIKYGFDFTIISETKYYELTNK